MKFLSKAALSQFLSRIANFCLLAFGTLKWSPPAWLSRLSRAVVIYVRAHPKLVMRRASFSLLALLVVGASWAWWTSRPQPQYCSVQVQPPAPPDLVSQKSSILRIQFGCSAALMSEVAKTPAKIPELGDDMPGTWTWESDRSLVFKPEAASFEKDWKTGEEYSVKLPSGLLAPHVQIEKSKYSFSPVSLSVQMSDFSFNVDARNPAIRRVSGTAYSNWPLDPESFRKLAKLEFSKSLGALGSTSSDLPVVMSFNPTYTEAYISTEKLPVPDYGSTVRLVVKGRVDTAAGGNGAVDFKQASEIPGRKGSFKLAEPSVIYARNERFEPEQALVLTSNLEIETENVAKALRVWTLPVKHPKHLKEKGNYSWSSFAEVSPEILAQSTLVELEVLPSEAPRSKSHSFRMKKPVEAGRYIYLEVSGGLTALGDYALGDSFLTTLEVPSIPKELRILGDGILLSLSGDRKLSVGARGVKKARIEVSRVLPDQLNHFVRALSYQDLEKARIYEGATDGFAERFTKDIPLANLDSTRTEYFTVDMDNFSADTSSRRGLFYIRLSEVDGPTLDERLILVTDLGFLAKKSAQGSYDVFVQNLKTGQAVASAAVEVLGANGLPAFSTTTDGGGRARLPSLDDFKRERRPIAFVVRNGESLSFLPLEYNYSRTLKMERFDTGGIYESTESDSLSAMLFSDRGIYRPGEKVHIGGIVRSRNIRTLQSDVPIKWVVSDPRGNEVASGNLKVSTGSLVDIGFDTQFTSPTGTWSITLVTTNKAKVEQTIGSTTVRVEEFQPDRIKISSRFSNETLEGWVDPSDLSVNVALQNLFGTPAQDRRVKSLLRVTPVVPRFKKLQGYEFAAIHSKDEQVIEMPLGDALTDSSGKLTLPLDLKSIAQGMYSLRFEAEGFESKDGGRSVMTASSLLVSRLPYLVGVKPDGSLSYIAAGSDRKIDLLAVNSKLEAQSVSNVELALIENRWVSVLMQDSNGAYKYQSLRKEIPLSSQKLQITKKGLNFALKTEKAGDFTLIIRNDQGIELNRVAYSVTGSDSSPLRMDRNAELQLTLSKDDYRVGEEVELQIRAPYAGRGLITIERDQVYAYKWFQSSGTSTVESIQVPEGLEGNAYVSVSFLRDSGSREIYMSPLSYAVAPFSLAREDFETKITLEAPERVRPGEKLVVRYSANRTTDLTLWGVDEGVHLVAKYKAPSPLDFFLRKKALQVSTLQILDLLLPEFSILKELLPAGGDESSDAVGKNLNPFRRRNQPPVAFWSGVLKADGQKRSFTYEVPDYYNGNLKIIAVASSRQGMGLSQASTLVRGDLILTPTAPLFATPGDEFEVSVSVANQTEGSGKDAKVDLSLSVDKGFDVVGAGTAKLPLAEGDETTHSFRLKARDTLGAFPLTLRASTLVAGKEKSASYKMEVSLRPSTPFVQTEEFRVSKSFPQTFKLEERRSELAKSRVLLSSNPLDMVRSLSDFLEGFPYGCTEQVLSRALSQLVMRGRFTAGGKAPPLKDGFESALSELRTRQRSDGGFSLYAGGASQLFPSLWALQYLIEAEGRGLVVPQNMIEEALGYAENLSFRSDMSMDEARWVALGAYLVARSGRVPRANLVEFETEVLQKRPGATSDIAAVYLAGTYKLLKQDRRADGLIAKIGFGTPVLPDMTGFYSTMVRDAGLLLVVARHFPERLGPLLTTENMEKFFAPLKQGQLQTLSAGLTLLALDSVASSGSFPKSQFKNEGSEQVLGDGKRIALGLQAVGIGAVASDLLGGVKEVLLKGSSESALFASLSHAGFEKLASLKEIKSGLEVSRSFRRADSTEVSGSEPEVKQDETLDVVLRLRSLKGQVDHVALVDLIPSGFEIVMTPAPVEAVEESEESPEPEESPSEGSEDDVGSRFQLLPTAYAQSAVSSPMWIQGQDRREDRMVLYATATEKMTEFVYKVKAVSRGSFVVPPTFAESMYDRQKRYRGLPTRIKIVKPE
jgi:alpha-2-macroglobulin